MSILSIWDGQAFVEVPAIRGYPGATGATGADSTVPGATGSTGPKGDTGLTGATGPAGADGATGPAGTDGKTWYSGTVDPTTEGVDGDWYVNRTTWHVWEKVSGTWTDRGTIKGADGDVVGPSSAQADGIPVFDGTTGKLLKDSLYRCTDFIRKNVGSGKGYLVGFSGPSSVSGIAPGTDGQVLMADSAQTLGVKWATPSASGGANLWQLLL